MDWQEVIEHPSLQDLPFKIELDEYGNIVMSPASNRHGRLQITLLNLLQKHGVSGEVYLECAVTTRKGVKVADVAWASAAFCQRYGETTPLPVAPEICVEVLSPSNTGTEMTEKIDLYLAKGAREVWLCDNQGRITIHAPEGVLDASRLLPSFPPDLGVENKDSDE